MPEASSLSSRYRALWGSAVLGFSLGGFLDGILLHQVLQWHHLFSLVPGEQWRDIRNQILMDGWFHVFHYGVACAGLYLLWSGRFALAQAGARKSGTTTSGTVFGFDPATLAFAQGQLTPALLEALTSGAVSPKSTCWANDPIRTARPKGGPKHSIDPGPQLAEAARRVNYRRKHG